MDADVDEALHAVFEVNRVLRDAGERIAASAGQTHARRMVLQAAGEGATVADIARGLGLQRQSVQRVADKLVRDGLARYDDNPHHRRSRLLITTAIGERKLAAIRCAHRAWIEDVDATVGQLDWSRLRTDLERVMQAAGAPQRPVSVGRATANR